MGLRRSPLFSTHAAASAEFAELDGWILPARYGLVEEETRAVRSGAGLYDLAPDAAFSMIGPDARRFCNGMFTNNIRDLKPGFGNRSAMTDEKGRMLGLMDLWCLEEGSFLAVLDGVTAEWFTARYGKFIILDDVELEDLSDTLTLLSVQGPKAAAVLATAGLPVPEPGGVAVAADVRVHHRPRSIPGGYDVLVPKEAAVALWEALRGAGGVPVGLDAQEVLRIEAGRVRWPVDMGERALVHEMRLVEECCSFNKGCYIGQEVINRIDVMGQVQKKIWGLQMHEDAIPPLEAEVLLDGQPVGVARSGAREGGRARILAVLRKAAWQPGTVVQVQAAGRSVAATVCDLPFA